MEKKKILIEVEVTPKGDDILKRSLYNLDKRIEADAEDLNVTTIYFDGIGYNEIIERIRTALNDKLNQMKNN